MHDLPLQPYAPLWTTNRDGYVLVEVVLAEGRRYLDIYRRDGLYCTPGDPELAAEVTSRMRSAGVEVWDGDAWVLELKLAPYRHLWTNPRDMHLILRSPDGHPNWEERVVYRDGSHVRFYEQDVERAVIERMLAAGVERIDDCVIRYVEDEGNLDHQSNRWVSDAYHERDVARTTCHCRLVAQPSFDPWESWRLLEEHRPDNSSRYLVRYRTWNFETPLLFHEFIRLPPPEQGWQVRRRQEDVRLDRDHAEEFLRRLSEIRLSPFPNPRAMPWGHDGTSVELTLGIAARRGIQLSWWQDGPDEWRELIELLDEFCEETDRRRSIQIAGC